MSVSDRPASGPVRLSAEDAAILKLESPTIAGHTCKVIVVEPPAGGRHSIDALRDHVAARIERVPRCPTPTVIINMGYA